MASARTLIVDVGPLRERFYTGIPNVVAEICRRLIGEPGLDIYFDLDGQWIPPEDMARCLRERSGDSLAGRAFQPARAFRDRLRATRHMDAAVALYTDHRPPRKICPWEGKIVYDLSMVLAPECHPAGSVAMYTADLAAQIACSDVLFPISEATARDLAWIYGVGEERLKVALLGNDVDPAATRRARSLIGGRAVEPFLLVLGSIEPRKNAGLVLDWLRARPEVLTRVRVVFAGRQAWGDSFEHQVAARGLDGALASGRLVFLNFVDEAYRTMLLAAAAALLYPSLFEGFGLPLLEAMASGTPVLSSVSTSMPEVVGDCGYYFDPCDAASLHAAFTRLWSDRTSGAAGTMVEAALRRAASFSYDRTFRVIMAGLFPDVAPSA